jgi:hypothetical protein
VVIQAAATQKGVQAAQPAALNHQGAITALPEIHPPDQGVAAVVVATAVHQPGHFLVVVATKDISKFKKRER